MAERARAPGGDYAAAQERRHELAASLGGLARHERIDAVVEPTVPVVAPLAATATTHAGTDVELIPLTHFWNWTGFPVVAFPSGSAAQRPAGRRLARRPRPAPTGAARRRRRAAGGPRRARAAPRGLTGWRPRPLRAGPTGSSSIGADAEGAARIDGASARVRQARD